MAEYSIYLADRFGVRLADASHFVELSYSRVVNEVSSLTLTLPGNFDTQYIQVPDGRIEVWRQVPGGREYLDTEVVWLIRNWGPSLDDRGRKTITIEADVPLYLLTEPGRFVNYAAGSSQSDKAAAAADDQIKAFVRDNLGTSATGSRNISTYISVAPNLSLAPSIAKSAAWRELLKVCQELANASANDATTPTYLAFDIVAPTPDTLEFRTYVGQRGVDHRFPSGQNPVIIGPDFGNAGATDLRFDYRNEVTYAKAAGQGEGSDRLTATAEDTTRQGVSPFGYREKFVQATQYNTTTGLAAEAQAAVRLGRPRTIFRCKILDTRDTRYGVHWGWGDYVTAQAFGYSFDCRIDAITVSVAPGKETIDAWLKVDA